MIFRNSEQQILERIRDEIRVRFATTQAPEAVEAFLLQRWSTLLREIYLSRGGDHPDWQAGWDTVDALLWSLAPKKNRQETERLLRLLPILLGRMREGCEALGLPAQETESLVGLLASLHAGLARAGLETAPDSQSRQTATQAAGLDLGASAGGSTVDMAVSATVAQPPDDGQAAARGGSVEALQLGDWVTFHSDEGDKRLRLQWVSVSGGMFLFADNQGLDALSLTRPRLQQRLARGELVVGV